MTLQPSFSNLAVIGDQPGTIIPALSQVGLEDGSYYKFDYNQWGQVWKVTHYAADAVNAQGQPTYTHALSYRRLDLPGSDLSAATPQTDCPRFTQEKTWAEYGVMNQSGEVTTSYSPWTPDMASCEVTMPDTTTKQVSNYAAAAEGWKKGLTTSEEFRSSGQLVKTTTLSWEHDGSASASYVLRTSVTDYRVPNLTQYVARRILGLVRYQYLYSGASSASSLRSQVGYVYDEPNDAQDTFLATLATQASQHDVANYGQATTWRGNANRTRRYSVDQQTGAVGAFVESRAGFDVAGSPSYSKDAAGHKTSLSYTDSFFQNVNRTHTNPQNQLKTYAYPTAVTDGDGFTTTTVFNYDMGMVRETRTPLPNVTTSQPGQLSRRYYDSAGRVIKSLTVDNGAYIRKVYRDKMDMVQTYTSIEAGVESYSAQVLDGVGRVRATSRVLPGSAGEYAGQLTDFDSMGRVARQSNPTETNASWVVAGDDAAAGWLYTQTSYDWKGRPSVVTNPGAPATTNEFLYDGCGCAGGATVTTRDEVGRRQRTVYDVLGRVWKTFVFTQQDKSLPFTVGQSEVPYSTTMNDYDVRDQLKSTREYQGAETSGIFQESLTTYDGHGRVATNKTPEQSSPTVYLYDADDKVRAVTDARGAAQTFTYNNRHLVTQINHSAPSGVALPDQINFGYDAVGNRTSMSDGSGSVAYYYDALSRLETETRQFNGLSGSFPITYSYNLAGQLKSIADPFNSVINYQYNTGTLSGVTGSGFPGVSTYASGIKFRAWGGLREYTFGKNIQHKVSMTYDARLRASSYRLTDLLANPIAYGEDYQYDVWDNMKSRTGWHWSHGVPAFNTTYVNNRTSLYTYNADGVITQEGTTQYTYDSMMRLVTMTEPPRRTGRPAETINQVFDGDGQLVKRREKNTDTYRLNSTLLKGALLTTINSQGQKVTTLT